MLQRIRIALALERNVLVLSATILLLLASIYTWYPLLPLHFRDLGASDAQVGLAYSSLTIAFSLIQFAGGLLADRYGRKWLIALPTFIFIPLYILAGATRNWMTLLIALLIVNSLSALQLPAFMALLAESVSERRRGRAFGVLEFAVSLSVALGPGLGAALLPLVGIRALIHYTALISLLCALLRAFGLREATHRPPPLSLGSLGYLRQAGFRWLLTAVCFFALTRVMTMWGPFVTLHAEDALGMEKPEINALFSLGGLAAMAASLLGGRLADRYGSRNLLIASSLGHVLTMLLWALAGNSMVVGLAFFVTASMGLQMGSVAYDALVTQAASAGSRGAFVGLLGTITGLTSAAAPAFGAYLRGSFGSTAPFWAALGLGTATALSLSRVVPYREDS